MENASRLGDRENPSSPTHSPTSNGNNNNNNNNGAQAHIQIQTTPRPMNSSSSSNNNRSEATNPYPTTFVQADTSNFKQVVQMLTGSSDSPKKTLINSCSPSSSDPPNSNPNSSPKGFLIPPIRAPQSNKKQGFKLYERRRSLKNGLMISPLISAAFAHHHQAHSGNGFSPRKTPEILSPSMLDFPKLVLSPVTPLTSTVTAEDSIFNRSSSSSPYSSPEEAKAIAEKGFYLHPLPMTTTPRDSSEPPQLLPLFPVTSPRVSGSSSST